MKPVRSFCLFIMMCLVRNALGNIRIRLFQFIESSNCTLSKSVFTDLSCQLFNCCGYPRFPSCIKRAGSDYGSENEKEYPDDRPA